MPRFSLLRLLLVGAVLSLFRCDPAPPVDIIPTNCTFDTEPLVFSNPRECSPQLTRFDRLDRSIGSVGDLPELPEDCTGEGVSHIMELAGATDNDFTLHVYNGTANRLNISVYAANGCDVERTVLACYSSYAVADKIRVSAAGKLASRYFVRFTVGAAPATRQLVPYSVGTSPPLLPADFVAFAAYDDDEPASAGSIAYYEGEPDYNKYPDQRDGTLGRLRFNCDGTAFQRLIINDCEQDEQVLRAWAKMTGLPISEQYYGPKGNVIALAMPPGMDPNTGGDGARTARAKINTGSGGTSEPDYLINLFTPRVPGQTGGGLTMFADDPVLKNADLPTNYLQRLLPPFNPQQRFNPNLPEVLVSILDSGVDTEAPNRRLWDPTRYDKPLTTQFARRGALGFDFIEKDWTPDDRTPHGTYVAGAMIDNYRAENPLQTVHFRIFGREGIASYFGALVSIYESAAIGSDIINMSWGIRQAKPPQALECALGVAINSGAYLVTSAGNDDADLDRTAQWPANFAAQYPDKMATVAAYWYGGKGLLEERDPKFAQKVYFSNFGPRYAGMAAFLTANVPAPGGGIVNPTGTSISAPIITGRLAAELTRQPSDGLNALRRTLDRSDGLDGVTLKSWYLPLPSLNSPNPRP